MNCTQTSFLFFCFCLISCSENFTKLKKDLYDTPSHKISASSNLFNSIGEDMDSIKSKVFSPYQENTLQLSQVIEEREDISSEKNYQERLKNIYQKFLDESFYKKIYDKLGSNLAYYNKKLLFSKDGTYENKFIEEVLSPENYIESDCFFPKEARKTKPSKVFVSYLQRLEEFINLLEEKQNFDNLEAGIEKTIDEEEKTLGRRTLDGEFHKLIADFLSQNGYSEEKYDLEKLLVNTKIQIWKFIYNLNQLVYNFKFFIDEESKNDSKNSFPYLSSEITNLSKFSMLINSDLSSILTKINDPQFKLYTQIEIIKNKLEEAIKKEDFFAAAELVFAKKSIIDFLNSIMTNHNVNQAREKALELISRMNDRLDKMNEIVFKRHNDKIIHYSIYYKHGQYIQNIIKNENDGYSFFSGGYVDKNYKDYKLTGETKIEEAKNLEEISIVIKKAFREYAAVKLTLFLVFIKGFESAFRSLESHLYNINNKFINS